MEHGTESFQFDCSKKSPSLIVFDLDNTLWPFTAEYLSRPLRVVDGLMYDNKYTHIRLFPGVSTMLRSLSAQGYKLAIASRTSWKEGADRILKHYGIINLFVQREMYPGNKTKHFDRIQVQSGIPFSEMLFFDDEKVNIRNVSALGVICKLVLEGLNLENLKDGLETFSFAG